MRYPECVLATTIFKSILGLLAEVGTPWLVILLVAGVGTVWFVTYMVMELRAIKQGLARAEQQAKEDRERNERDHDRLLNAVEGLREAVAGLQSNVQVLLDRSDRCGDQGSSGPRE